MLFLIEIHKRSHGKDGLLFGFLFGWIDDVA